MRKNKPITGVCSQDGEEPMAFKNFFKEANIFRIISYHDCRHGREVNYEQITTGLNEE